MIVFNLPYSKQLTVKTTKNVQITEAALLNGQQTKLIEVACNEYNISIPKTPPTEPFVIKLKIKTSEVQPTNTRMHLHKFNIYFEVISIQYSQGSHCDEKSTHRSEKNHLLKCVETSLYI